MLVFADNHEVFSDLRTYYFWRKKEGKYKLCGISREDYVAETTHLIVAGGARVEQQ